MVSTTDADRTEKLGITLPISLLKQIESKRGDIPRSTFIRRALETYLKGSKRWWVMFGFIKKLKPMYEIPELEQQLTVRERALYIKSTAKLAMNITDSYQYCI
jgi:hypothetical protein